MILDDICILIADCPHSTAPDEGNGYPLIRTPNIGFGRFSLDGVHRVSEAVYNERTVRAVPQDNDIILAREAPAGNAAIIKNNLKFCLGQRTVLIRPNPKMVYPDYLVYYLLAPEQQYKLLSKAHGATVAHVNIPDIHSMNVNNLPDLPTQRRIASILSAYDDLIENNRRQIKLLEEAAQRLYREWFVELRFPGHESVKVVDGVPEGWTVTTASEVTNVLRRGISPNYDETARLSVISQKCIRQYMVDMNQVRRQSKSFDSSMGLLDSDTVICSTGTGTLGRVGKVFGNHPNCTFDSHVTLVRTNGTVGKHYLNLRACLHK